MNANDNALNWFEIPAVDIKRARSFYEKVFNVELQEMVMGDMIMAAFPSDMSGKVSGALVQSSMHKPSMDGVVIYLNGNPDLAVPLSKVEVAGGQVLMPKTKVTDEIGYIAFFQDTEGNKVAFHSGK